MMNTIIPARPFSYSLTTRYVYIVAWAVFLLVFAVSGAVGHDPWWKRGEAYTFGIVYHFYVTHSWLIPVNAGAPFMEKPPLFYWTCVLMCKMLGGILPLHDAARFASIFYSALSALFVWKTAGVLFSRNPQCQLLRNLAVLLFFGNYGLIHFSHAMSTDTALLAGTTIAMYGMAQLCIMPERYRAAGAWLGFGLGIAFMSKGLVMPCIIGVSFIALYVCLKELRTRETRAALLIASLACAPFVILWPLLLYHYSPTLFMQWLWDNNIGRFIGFSVPMLGAANRPFYFLWLAPIFAFPTFPMACAEAFITRAHWRKPEYLLPLSLAITGMAVLLISASGRAPYLLPLMPAFALLAAPLLMRLPARFLFGWNGFVKVGFSVTIALTWLLWWTLHFPQSDRPVAWLADLFDKYIPGDFVFTQSQPVACCAAVFAGVFWIVASIAASPVQPPSRWREGGGGFRGEANYLYTARLWFIGAASLWCTTHTLLLPWINENHSYRTPLTRLLDFVQHSPHAHDCIGNNDVGENIAPMMQYFTGKEVAMPMQSWDGTACKLLLVFADKNTSPADMHPGWHMLWQESHMRDMRNMELRLYERTP